MPTFTLRQPSEIFVEVNLYPGPGGQENLMPDEVRLVIFLPSSLLSLYNGVVCRRGAMKRELKKIGRFHVLTDTCLQTRFSHAELAELAICGGADTIQFRQKEGGTRDDDPGGRGDPGPVQKSGSGFHRQRQGRRRPCFPCGRRSSGTGRFPHPAREENSRGGRDHRRARRAIWKKRAGASWKARTISVLARSTVPPRRKTPVRRWALTY